MLQHVRLDDWSISYRLRCERPLSEKLLIKDEQCPIASVSGRGCLGRRQCADKVSNIAACGAQLCWLDEFSRLRLSKGRLRWRFWTGWLPSMIRGLVCLHITSHFSRFLTFGTWNTQNQYRTWKQGSHGTASMRSEQDRGRGNDITPGVCVEWGRVSRFPTNRTPQQTWQLFTKKNLRS
jgi:hypothetical protein